MLFLDLLVLFWKLNCQLSVRTFVQCREEVERNSCLRFKLIFSLLLMLSKWQNFIQTTRPTLNKLAILKWPFLLRYTTAHSLVPQALVSLKKYMPLPLPYFKVNICPLPLPYFASIFFAYLWSFRWSNYIVTLPRYFSFRLPHLCNNVIMIISSQM
jgi:hypothetical protein